MPYPHKVWVETNKRFGPVAKFTAYDVNVINILRLLTNRNKKISYVMGCGKYKNYLQFAFYARVASVFTQCWCKMSKTLTPLHA